MTQGYDDGYRRCPCFWGTTPGTLVRGFVDQHKIAGMHVLDLGAGEGKNAYFLAALGATVDAVESSELALENSRAIWGAQAGVRWIHADASGLEWNTEYDLVIMYGYLHCLKSRDSILEQIRSSKAATLPGGWIILCSFNDRCQDLRAHPGFSPTLIGHADYISAFVDWKVESATDSDLSETHPHNNIPHTHSMTRLVAQRPR